jgi:hypothetical protein
MCTPGRPFDVELLIQRLLLYVRKDVNSPAQQRVDVLGVLYAGGELLWMSW